MIKIFADWNDTILQSNIFLCVMGKMEYERRQTFYSLVSKNLWDDRKKGIKIANHYSQRQSKNSLYSVLPYPQFTMRYIALYEWARCKIEFFIISFAIPPNNVSQFKHLRIFRCVAFYSKKKMDFPFACV